MAMFSSFFLQKFQGKIKVFVACCCLFYVAVVVCGSVCPQRQKLRLLMIYIKKVTKSTAA